MTHVLEITTLTPAPGRTAADFVEANKDIDAYLARQPGYRWRNIAVREDGTVVDIVAWDSEEQARTSAAGIMTEMASSPVHDTIDHTTVDWRVIEVLHTA
ncbi:antibiotic biosynthesis monooxygenase [Streptomyces sp. GESEQ-35]|uniref:antibiotic biosynthesis monooxygenase family protein n=1 Tax=Streptomyces sp. GESEQ-35 TaxID=2812657 RepID=UPI001B32592E|nr:hypothetical protein [Streptomyces sp. GESEQ-35]